MHLLEKLLTVLFLSLQKLLILVLQKKTEYLLYWTISVFPYNTQSIKYFKLHQAYPEILLHFDI